VANLTEQARTVLEKRYLLKKPDGSLETPEEMFRRVAHAVSAVDNYKYEEDYFELMDSLTFLPNSPTLMNAGTELGMLSACFVLSVDDSMQSILQAQYNMGLIHKWGGGVGFSFSRLRPKGDLVTSTQGVSSGPVSFIKMFNATTEAVFQGGKRRGASMGVLNVDHPDILDFVMCKVGDEKSFDHFNLSVGITDKFMQDVLAGRFYTLINPKDKSECSELDAQFAFNLIAEVAWKCGDPGLLFLDRINRDNLVPELGNIEATNPCSEQPLLPFESCNLGSINVAKFYREECSPGDYSWKHLFNWEGFRRDIHLAIRFLDDVITVNKFPLPEIEETTKKLRPIGLGIMGWADLLLKIGISYNSEEALRFANTLVTFLEDNALSESRKLAGERGSFPYFQTMQKPGEVIQPYRNLGRLSIAPTGSISLIAGCSGGIEPIFALDYERDFEGQKLRFIHPELEKWRRENPGVEGPSYFVSAHDISPEWHLRMLSVFQEHIDSGVSKTINLPKTTTVEEVKQIFLEAWEAGCKGVTVFRDGCKSSQVLTKTETKKLMEEGYREMAEKNFELAEASFSTKPRERPKSVCGVTTKKATGCGSLFITVNNDNEGMFEVFCTLGKSGGCATAQLEAIGRLLSLALRSNVDVEAIIEQLKGIRCPSPVWEDGHCNLSCADAISSVLAQHLSTSLNRNLQLDFKVEEKEIVSTQGQCPECSSQLIFKEGCFTCMSCGYTKCG